MMNLINAENLKRQAMLQAKWTIIFVAIAEYIILYAVKKQNILYQRQWNV